MQIKKGIAVSPGVAISKAVVLDAEDQPVPRRKVPAHKVESELEHLERALAASANDLQELSESTTETLGPEMGRIFGFHLGLLLDPHLTDQFKKQIRDEHVTAEYAVFAVMREQARSFRRHEKAMIREKATDIWDLEHRILKHLIGEAKLELTQLSHDAIVVAHDLTPSQTASLDRNKIRALVTDAGGRTSHTAILAHALGIPAIVGAEGVSAMISTGDRVIIDGNNGIVVVDPDAAKLMEYREEEQRIARALTKLFEIRALPAVTTDGTKINLLANIEFPSEIPTALEKGAMGIGLYRTEFLYLASESEPTEDEQYEAYCASLRSLNGKQLTIRTLDLGADKLSHSEMDGPSEANPFLGCRSIRLCLQNLPLFKTQLRAILRASVEGPVSVMFPLISSVMELRQAKMILNDVKEDLDDEGIEYSSDIPIGIMIEVPSAALQAHTLSREADFFSIGTNDLVQYTLAADRGNERIADLYTAGHPAVLQLLKMSIDAAAHASIDISICGEMAGEPEYLMLLLGLGLRTLSITPPAIPEAKKVIRSLDITQCKKVASWAQNFDSDRGVTNFLRNEIRKIVPEVFDGRSIG